MRRVQRHHEIVRAGYNSRAIRAKCCLWHFVVVWRVKVKAAVTAWRDRKTLAAAGRKGWTLNRIEVKVGTGDDVGSIDFE